MGDGERENRVSRYSTRVHGGRGGGGKKSTQTTLSEDVTMKFNTVCTLVKIK